LIALMKEKSNVADTRITNFVEGRRRKRKKKSQPLNGARKSEIKSDIRPLEPRKVLLYLPLDAVHIK
jgi:hypothetical protein